MLLVSLILLAAPVFQSRATPSDAAAQDDRYREAEPLSLPAPLNPLPEARPGQTANSAAGQVGQRQTRERVAVDTGIDPLGRIAGRIQSRVQSRVRNRVDRYYDPQANATSPFVVAGDQARTAGRRPQ